MGDVFGAVMMILSGCGGIAGIIAASGWAKAEKIRAEGRSPRMAGVRDDAVLAELKALKEQMQEIQSTGHQFDISFDATLTRLEERVNRIETKSAAATANEETRQRLGVG
jgi:hypothetical protein